MLAAVLVLSSAAQLGGAVVCLGLDGHVDVESLLEGCCISGTAGDPGEDAGLALAGATCGDCTDLQLKMSLLRSKGLHLTQQDLDADCVACSPRAVDGRSASFKNVSETDQRRQTLKPLTTVVLQT